MHFIEKGDVERGKDEEVVWRHQEHIKAKPLLF